MKSPLRNYIIIAVDVLISSGCSNKVPWNGWLKQMFISYSFGNWKSDIKAPADLVSDEDLLPGLR